ALQEQAYRVDRLDDPAVAGEQSFCLALMLSHLGDGPAAVDQARRAIERATRAGDIATAGRAHYVLAREQMWGGRHVVAIRNGRQAVALLEAAADPWWLAQAHIWVGMNLHATGDFEAADAAWGTAGAIAGALGDPLLTSYLSWAVG